MVQFKLVIGDKSGKCKQVEVKDDNAKFFVGKKIGDKVKGESVDMPGYEFEISGGADYCGFPMRKDVEGPVRKQIMIVKGIGLRKSDNGVKYRRTVCGNMIHEKTSQISLKVLKAGKAPLFEEAKAEEKPAESPK